MLNKEFLISFAADAFSGYQPHFFTATAFTFSQKRCIIGNMNIEELKMGIKNIREPRRTGYGNIRHKLEDIIIIGLCTVICGGEDFADMEAFGKSRQEYLGKYLELPNGIPDSDTFRRVFEKLDPYDMTMICSVEFENEEIFKGFKQRDTSDKSQVIIDEDYQMAWIQW